MTESDEPSSLGKRIERSHLPRIEFRKSQRRDAVFYCAAFMAAALSWVVRFVPDAFEDWVALRLGDLSYLLSKSWRANVDSNVSHVLDDRPNSARVRRTTRSIFQTNALNVGTMLRSPHQTPQQLIDSVRLTHGDWSVLDDALAKGSGVIVLTGHLGSFDTMGSAISARGYPIAAITARTTNRFTFEFISFLRAAHRVKLIEASSGGVREAIEWVRAGHVLCLLSDRDFFVNGIEVEFFGEQTTLPVGAIRIARESGATVVPMFTLRQGRNHGLMIEQPFVVERTPDRSDDVKIGMQRVVAALEAAIEIAPEQWAMFQRVWPEDEPEATE
jgi:KDO2-lipid IV(A) lauroyltransferase